MVTFPPNVLFSVFSFIGFVLAALSLPWHVQSWNTGTCMFMLWTSLGCLIFFVNSIVWNDNVTNWAPVWCDISARYVFGGSVGLPASALCIVRRLYHMTTMRRITVEKKERIREIMVDVLIGIGFPCVVMAWEYVVQGHRFDIFEQIGCYPYIVNTLIGYFLLAMWPLVISLIGLVYAVLTFRKAYLLQGELKRVLQTGFSISTGRYWRLMAVCSAEIFFTVSLSLYVLIGDAAGGQLVPYVSWAAIHSDFSFVGQYPTTVWQNERGIAIGLESGRWIYVLSAFVIFGFFGWGPEARGFYQRAFWSAWRYLGNLSPFGPSSPTAISKQSRRIVYGEQSPAIDGGMRSVRLPVPIQARAKRHSFRPSLSFEAPPRRDSLSSTGSSRLSVDERSLGDIPKLPSMSSLVNYTRISWEILPASPEPALGRDWRTRTLSEEAGSPV